MQAVFSQALDMKDDSIANLDLNFSNRSACCDTPRQIWHVGGEIVFCLFNDYCVTHKTSLETSLLKNTVQCARRQIIAKLARHSNAT